MARPRGAPTKFSLDIQKKLIEALKVGATLDHAVAYAGIAENTYRNWMAKGEKVSSGPFRDFLNAVHEATPTAAVANLTNIRRLSRDDWRASAWVLEHRFPEHYGRRDVQKHEHSGPAGQPIIREVLIRREVDGDSSAA